MGLAVCVLLAYLDLGVTRILKDLNADLFARPFWANNPTPGMAIFVGLFWWYDQALVAQVWRFRSGPRPRPVTPLLLTFAFVLLTSALKVGFAAFLIWGWYAIFWEVGSPVLRVLATGSLYLLTRAFLAFVVWPLATFSAVSFLRRGSKAIMSHSLFMASRDADKQAPGTDGSTPGK